MNIRTYCRVSAIVFTVVALAHLARLIYGIADYNRRRSHSNVCLLVGLIGPGALAYWGFQGAQGTG